MVSTEIRVEPSADGKWIIKEGGSGKAFVRRRDAHIAARKLAGARGGGTVRVYNIQKRVSDIEHVPPARVGVELKKTTGAQMKKTGIVEIVVDKIGSLVEKTSHRD